MKRNQHLWLALTGVLFVLAGFRDLVRPGFLTMDGGRHPHFVSDVSVGMLLLGFAVIQRFRANSRRV